MPDAKAEALGIPAHIQGDLNAGLLFAQSSLHLPKEIRDDPREKNSLSELTEMRNEAE